MEVAGSLSWVPVTPAHLDAFEALLGARGGCAGCWCMLWRLSPKEWRQGQAGGNRLAMRHLVESGSIPGILLYANATPIAWCSVARRQTFSGLGRARVLRPLDARDVWSITCLFVDKTWRRRGISVALIRAACEFVAAQGGRIVEGYPVVPPANGLADPFAWTGLPSAFLKAGFTVEGQRSPTRPIMRKAIAPA